MDLFLREYGPTTGPPLVLLHGFMGTHADWASLLPRLGRRFRCLLPDWPGHGASRLDIPPAYASWNAALRASLLHRAEPPFFLAGYSMGGRLALDFALRYPGDVAALALLAANPGIEAPAARQQRLAWDEANARQLQTDQDAFLQRWYDLPLFASLARHPGLKARLRARRRQQDAMAMAAVIRQMSPGRQPSLWHQVPHLRMPTLALAGQLDEKYTRLVARLAAESPQVRALVLPFAGHALHLERPARVAWTLCAFFAPLGIGG